MARDGVIASLDVHATCWQHAPLDEVTLGRAQAASAGLAVAGDGDALEPTVKARGRVEAPGATLAGSQAPRMAVAGMLDILGLPALIVDSLGRVLDANRAAHLTLNGGLRLVNGRLSAGDRRISIGLRNLVMQAASAQAMPPVVVPRSDQYPLLVYAFPFRDGPPEAPPADRAIVVVLDLGRKATPPALHLRHVFGLTGAQARLAALLASGTDLDTVADVLGISKETARGHLRAIFARTGVRRQSELVALIARLLPVGAGAHGDLDRLLDALPGCEAGGNQVDRC